MKALTVAEELVGRVPPLAERPSHGTAAATAQFSGFVPVFSSVKFSIAGTNGPPILPPELNPLSGRIWSASDGGSKASCTPVVVELAGEVALKPMPRLPNAAHNSFRS